MTGLRMKYLALALSAFGMAAAHAAGGDITRQETTGGSVELSNLGPEEAQVVVSAPPAGAKVEAPVQRPVPPVPQARVAPRTQEASAGDQAGKPRKQKRECDNKDAENTDCDAESVDNTADAAAVGSDASRPSWASASPYAPGYSFGGANGNGGNTGGGTGGGSYPWGGGSASNGGGGSTGNTGGDTTAGGTNGSPLDSPEALAARLVQYQQMMLNEERRANGLVANPAVQRRYLMMNRSTYNRLGM